MGFQEYFGKEHNQLRGVMRELVKKEILPHADDWEEAGEFPILSIGGGTTEIMKEIISKLM